MIPCYESRTLTKSELGGFNVWKPKLMFSITAIPHSPLSGPFRYP